MKFRTKPLLSKTTFYFSIFAAREITSDLSRWKVLSMNNLQVKTTELKPAVITFNHEEISRELDATLEKYANLVFTEENKTDLRNTRSEEKKSELQSRVQFV